MQTSFDSASDNDQDDDDVAWYERSSCETSDTERRKAKPVDKITDCLSSILLSYNLDN